MILSNLITANNLDKNPANHANTNTVKITKLLTPRGPVLISLRRVLGIFKRYTTIANNIVQIVWKTRLNCSVFIRYWIVSTFIEAYPQNVISVICALRRDVNKPSDTIPAVARCDWLQNNSWLVTGANLISIVSQTLLVLIKDIYVRISYI